MHVTANVIIALSPDQKMPLSGSTIQPSLQARTNIGQLDHLMSMKWIEVSDDSIICYMPNNSPNIIDTGVTEQGGWIRMENSEVREYSEGFSLQAKETKSRSLYLNSSPKPNLTSP